MPGLLRQAGVQLPAERLEQLAWLGAELLRWNQARNLTAITDPAEQTAFWRKLTPEQQALILKHQA